MDIQSLTGRQKLVGIVVIAFLFLCGLGAILPSPDPVGPQQNTAAVDIDSTEQVDADEAIDIAHVEEPEIRSEPTIPGLEVYDVQGNLEDEGFECEKSTYSDETLKTMWLCELDEGEKSYSVEIWARDSFNVYAVEANGLNYTETTNTAALGDFMSFIATLPYEGSNPQESSEWVKENLEQHDVTHIQGDVSFTIYGEGRAKILSIAHQDYSLD